MANHKTNHWMYVAIISIVLNLVLILNTFQTTSTESLLFIQNAESTTFQKDKGETFTLTMNNAPETLYFTNHPYRNAGNMPSIHFADLLNQEKNDPLNAILQVKMSGAIRHIPLELLSAESAEDNLTITYSVKALTVQEGHDLWDATSFTGTTLFNGAVLFIDDVPTGVNPQVTDSVDQT